MAQLTPAAPSTPAALLPLPDGGAGAPSAEGLTMEEVRARVDALAERAAREKAAWRATEMELSAWRAALTSKTRAAVRREAGLGRPAGAEPKRRRGPRARAIEDLPNDCPPGWSAGGTPAPPCRLGVKAAAGHSLAGYAHCKTCPRSRTFR